MKSDASGDPYQLERLHMVEEQIRSRGIADKRVLAAMGAVPRHLFVPPEHHHLAYADGPLPIGCGQTISQPYIVAYMTELLCLGGDERVLEVGTGSGYQAAILSCLAKEVWTIERHPELAERATSLAQALGLANVHVRVGDGSVGYAERAPYQAIVVTAAAPDVPQPLLDQLAEGGLLVIPVGGQWGQFLERWQRRGGRFHQEVLAPVAFVPLRGQSGWKDDAWRMYET